MANIVAVDLFCGAGGLTYGLEKAGIDVRLGIDLDPKCQYPLEKNTKAKFLKCDITKLKAQTLLDAWGDGKIRLLAGCAPCQPFSTYTQGKLDKNDPRWSLLHSFARLIDETRPEIVTMENVGKLTQHNVFKKFISSLENNGYTVKWDILDCRQYGIPQSRRRLVLIASRFGTPQLPKPVTLERKKWKTVRQMIGELPAIASGEASKFDPLHTAAKLSALNLKRIKNSKPGGSWKDWPKKLITPCHRKSTGKTYASVYGRMKWSDPSPTITGQCYGYGNGRFGHPRQHRAISLREAAILQSFPANYSFLDKKERLNMKSVGLMIGNAVPPKLGKAIGLAILRHIKEHKKPRYKRRK